ncbi:MAG TPA: HAMP domain-containing sensor histidine kinase [Bryobacteraceae bacterium]|jgi:signal transduction histidine kinase|nr:HAMP domain-containing sensor histidine kinase [Bryobacteraceae bacterium]
MVVGGRRKSIAFFISLGAGLIVVTILLYVGWVVFDWHRGILLFFGFLMAAVIIAGVVLNTIFLVREIRRNEQHNAFINAVTHELKTPVASIRLYLETLLTRNVDEQTRAGFYRTMLEDSDRLLTTIEQVLRTGRVGPETRLLHSVPVDLNALLEECVERARALHKLTPDALRCETGTRVTVMGDEDELRAAVSNLIENAVKYSGTEKKIAAGIECIKGRYAAVSVRDEGIGIPKAELKRIFRRFYRVPGAAARRSGTGLGLFIVRSVAKRHGGRAWAESEGPGRGSRFVIELPAAR